VLGLVCCVGNVFDQQSSLFQEEFPQLTSSAEDKTPTSKRADECKDAQRGPVLDPKHQGNITFMQFILPLRRHFIQYIKHI